ncbi:AraC family transcriptional regulator [Massiliimalia timonensis]|uniref:AraC family transcriptional regulator n=1 Tax=Massiliimalia timonensis TaxID=1987501 RepID=UPI000B8ADD28|nr:AraC family transcriptional regulator [Massiliimalia timonensis]MBS7176039.1 AraC family transcriptional regulator [Clostridiales bacterium]
MQLLSSSLKEGVRHGNPSLPIVVYYPTLDTQCTQLAAHWHEEMEISLVQKGEGIYSIDAVKYHVKQGDILIIPPRSLHSGHSISGHDSQNTTVLFNTSVLASSSKDICNSQYILPLQECQLPITNHILADTEEAAGISEIIQRISDNMVKQDKAFSLKVKSLLFELLYKIILVSPKEKITLTTNIAIEKIKLALEYIQANYMKKIYIKDLALLTSYSESYFSKIFKQATQCSCIDYINQYRIIMAQNQLLETTKPITEIALDVGFENISYFCKEFLHMNHMTARQYRDLYKN